MGNGKKYSSGGDINLLLIKKNSMKKAVLLLSLLIPIFGMSQKAIDKVTLSNGKTIVVYDDYTWRETNSTNAIPLLGSPVKKTSASTKSAGISYNSRKKKPSTSSSKSSSSGYCGAPTKKGGACRRRVAGGGYCWQHGG